MAILMGMGPTSEFILRSVALTDLPAIHAIQRRSEQHDSIALATPLSEFEEWFSEPHFDLNADSRVVEVLGRITAWGRVWHRPSGERLEHAYLFGTVDPEQRHRGMGSALLQWQLARARARLNALPPVLPRFIRTQAYESQASAIRLYVRHGMIPVRYNDELLRELDTIPVAEPMACTIARWDRTRAEDARLVVNAAFADHWGSTTRDSVSWEHDLAATGSRLDLSFMALEDGAVVGVSRNHHFADDEAVTGRREGWIFQLAVLKTHRKRGIATALIRASLAAFRDAGFTHAALGVDSANPTGAYQLYERIGFLRMRRSVVHEVALPVAT